jgi:hypothetical protein
MIRPRVLRRLLGLGTLLAVAAACARAPSTVTYTVQPSGFGGPDSVPSGWTEVTLTNDSSGVDHAQFVMLDAGKTADELAAALAADPERFPDWSHPMGGPNAPDPGGSATAVVNLEPGAYALLSFIPNGEGVPGLARGFLKPVTVTDQRSGGAEPKGDATVELADFSMTLSGEVAAGERTLRFNNGGSQPHEAYLVKLNEGVTADDYLNASPDAPPPATGLGGITAIEPGAHQFIVANLEPGNYAMFCFLADAATHAPHFALGMLTEFTVK